MRAGIVLHLCLALAGAAACTSTPAQRTFTLQGQVVSIEPASKRVTVKDGEIKGLMPNGAYLSTIQKNRHGVG